MVARAQMTGVSQDVTIPVLEGARAGGHRWVESLPAVHAMNPSRTVGALSDANDNQKLFDGTFDGHMRLWKLGFPCDVTSTCATTGFMWTLAPH
jgi:hypothetical protein